MIIRISLEKQTEPVERDFKIQLMYSVTGIYGFRNKAFGFENESSGYRNDSNPVISGFKQIQNELGNNMRKIYNECSSLTH